MFKEGASGSWAEWAYNSVAGFLGWESLEVVDPNAGSSHKGTAAEGKHGAERKAFFSSYNIGDYIGKDVTSLLSVPVFIMEPFTMLQKMAEVMEYADALVAADKEDDPAMRLAYVSAFLMGPFPAAERIWKPFNPILGETFEFRRAGIEYVAEQVSHHPPIGAAHAESPEFSYDLVSAPKTKFLGNSVEVRPEGRTWIKLRRSGDVFVHRPPNARANNVLLGAIWIDLEGEFVVRNETTGDVAVIKFTPCGWFGAGRYECTGHVVDASGRKVLKLWGKWNAYLDCAPCDADGEALPDAEVTRIWSATPMPDGDAYGFTHFAHELNSRTSGCPCEGLLASDSRFRPDRIALEAGDNSRAAASKTALEEMQRAERSARGDSVWQPRWFDYAPDTVVPQDMYGLDRVPGFDWNSKYSGRSKSGLHAPDAEGVSEKFCPWQYPEMHS